MLTEGGVWVLALHDGCLKPVAKGAAALEDDLGLDSGGVKVPFAARGECSGVCAGVMVCTC